MKENLKRKNGVKFTPFIDRINKFKKKIYGVKFPSLSALKNNSRKILIHDKKNELNNVPEIDLLDGDPEVVERLLAHLQQT